MSNQKTSEKGVDLSKIPDGLFLFDPIKYADRKKYENKK
jgi:hypothetical protein